MRRILLILCVYLYPVAAVSESVDMSSYQFLLVNPDDHRKVIISEVRCREPKFGNKKRKCLLIQTKKTFLVLTLSHRRV
jgi:hypothetical protein